MKPALKRYLHRHLGVEEDRDEVLQESLVRLTSALHDFRGDSGVLHFAIQVARRVVASRRRAKRREKNNEARMAQLVLPLAVQPDSPESCAVKLRRRRELLGFLSALPAAQAETVMLRIIDGHSIEEVAVLTGAPIGTVRTRLRRAQQHLRNRIEADPALLELLRA